MKNFTSLFSSTLSLLSVLVLFTSSLIPSTLSAQSCPCEGRMRQVIFQYSETAAANASLNMYHDRYGSTMIESFTNIQPGDYLTIESSMIGLNRFGPKVFLDLAGTGSYAEVHTSCSEDIIGNVYGDFTVVAYIDYNDQSCYVPATLGNRVFEDSNGNGLQDTGEPGVDGISVILYDEDGNVEDTEITENGGLYEFTNLAPGIYSLGFGDLPSDYVNTIDNNGSDDELDSDVPQAGNMTTPITLNPSEVDNSWDLGILPAANFPVEFIGFGVIHKNNVASLEWKTATELNNDHFEIERSVDAQDFDMIGMVVGAGTSLEAQEYNYDDQEAGLLGKQILYYRLKQVDFDGQYSYSPVVELTMDQAATLSLTAYPNPVSDVLTIDALASEGEVMMIDLSGRIVYQKTLSQEASLQTITLNMNNFAPGMYMLQLSDQHSVKTQKLIKR